MKEKWFSNRKLTIILMILVTLGCGGGGGGGGTPVITEIMNANVVVEPAGGDESWAVVHCTTQGTGGTVNTVTVDLLLLGGEEDIELELAEQGDGNSEYRWQGYLVLPNDPATTIDVTVNRKDGSIVTIAATVEFKTDTDIDTTLVTLSAVDLAGPDGAIIYNGEFFTDTLTVPEDSIVAVWKDEQAFFYHPALGDVALSDSISQSAMAHYFSDFNEDATRTSLTSMLDTSRGMMIGERYDLATGVGIVITGRDEASGNYTFTAYNKTKIWVAVKTSSRAEPYFIPPKNARVETNFFRYLRAMSSNEKYALQNSQSGIEVEMGQPIETFCAWARSLIITAEEAEAARINDLTLCSRLNAVDWFWWWSEQAKIAGNAISLFECVDIAVNFLTNLVEVTATYKLAGESEGNAALRTLGEDVGQSALVCILETSPAVIGQVQLSVLVEVLASALDLTTAWYNFRENWLEAHLNDLLIYKPYDFIVPIVGDGESPNDLVGHWRVIQEDTTSLLWVADCQLETSGKIECVEYLWGAPVLGYETKKIDPTLPDSAPDNTEPDLEKPIARVGEWGFISSTGYFIVTFPGYHTAVCTGTIHWEEYQESFWVAGDWGTYPEGRFAWINQDCECDRPTCPDRCP
jgi:hypothetical protein